MTEPGPPQDTDTGAPRALIAVGIAILAGIALVMARWAHSALTDDNLPTALVAGLGALTMVAMIALGVANITRPEPRTESTARGLEIRPALYVSKLTVFTTVCFLATMALGAVLYATGNLDFHPGDRSERRFADKMFGLALVTPFLIAVPYIPAIRTWIRGERKPWQRNPAVLLSAYGVQIERLAVARFARWDQITDVRVVHNRSQRHLVITRHDGPPLVCDKLPLLGGSWLLDTIRTYWQQPQERSRLGGTPPPPAHPPAAPPATPGYPAPPPAYPPAAPPAPPSYQAPPSYPAPPAYPPPPAYPGHPGQPHHSGPYPAAPGPYPGPPGAYPPAPGAPAYPGGYPAHRAYPGYPAAPPPPHGPYPGDPRTDPGPWRLP